MKIRLLLCLCITYALNAQNVLVLTLPKTGTNLVLKLLRMALQEKDNPCINSINRTLYWGHEWKIYNEHLGKLEPNNKKVEILNRMDTKLFLVLRDPRQHVLALLRSINKPITHNNIAWGIKNFPKMMYLQSGTPALGTYKDINDAYNRYLEWYTAYPNVYLTSFEKIVGAKGGGDTNVQYEEVRNIINFLKINLNDQETRQIAQRLFGGTPTFKEGKIATWKKYYSPENKALFKRIAGDLLIKLGYEKDYNW